MTRKDYGTIAEAIHNSRPHPEYDYDPDGLRAEQWRDTMESVLHLLAARYPNFDRSRFAAACEAGL